ncbi:MAG TPA: hypothetical protein VLZ89_07790, partial [Anaerolineales bacterium]|nr:hypothetical protein [Anaerolineales bacterium]
MKANFRCGTLLMAVGLVLALSAAAAFPVLADGGSTPPPPPPAGRTPHGGSANSLSQIPSGTKVVILDWQGAKLPLGSQQAQDILASGDPVWCPSSVATPTNGGSCSPAGASLADVVTWLDTNDPSVNGTIWIESSYDRPTADPSSTSFSLDGLTLTNAAAHDLTIKGGWDGLGTNSTSGTTTVAGASLSITNWTGNILVSNTNFDGSGGVGLTVQTSKNITLKSVNASGNSNGGALLENPGGSGSVTVTGTAASFSQFNGNSSDGLDIVSKGAITLTDVNADGNAGAGAMLDNTAGSGTVTITGTAAVHSQFNGNTSGADGLDVSSHGAINLTNVDAEGNGGLGAALNNSSGTGSVAVAGTSANPGLFDGNLSDDGLDIQSAGAVTLTDVNADGNHGRGAYIDNSHAFTPQGVSVNNSAANTFDGNFLNGLIVLSAGSITVSNLNASGNGTGFDGLTYLYDSSGGVYLQNDVGTGSVLVNGTNTFTNNYEDGLDVYSNGAITTNNMIGSGNGVKGTVPDYVWVGAFLENAFNGYSKPVTVNGLNVFNSNLDDGLDVLSLGAIKANDLNAAYSANGSGVDLDNCSFLSDLGGTGCQAAAQSVTLTGINTFNDNHLDGLDVYSFGNITAADLNASGNGAGGALGQNAGVWLENDFPSYATALNSKGTVTLSGTNIFSDNVFDGLDGYSYGAIKASNIHAFNNGCDGAYLDNSRASTAQSVTLTNYNAFNYDGCDGLDVFSNGAVTLSSLSANDSGGYGTFIANNTSSVTLSGNDSFNGSYQYGLYVLSYGTITVNTTTLVAEGNGITGSDSGGGVYLDNCIDSGSGCTIGAAKAVTLNGTNVIDLNYGQYYDGVTTTPQAGLVIYSKGSIKVNNLTASDNLMGAGAL